MGGVGEANFLRRNCEVGAEELAQGSPAENVFVAILLEMETGGALPLILRKKSLQNIEMRRLRVQRSGIDMDETGFERSTDDAAGDFTPRLKEKFQDELDAKFQRLTPGTHWRVPRVRNQPYRALDGPR